MRTETARSPEISALVERLACAQDPALRMDAARRLGILHAAEAVCPLLSAINDSDPGVRAYAAGALGRIRHPDAAGGLMTALRDTDWRVRNEAVWALGRVRDRQALPCLVQMLHDEDWHVRWRAAAAIVEFGETAIEALIPASRDPDWHLRYAAVWALGKIDGPRAAAVLEPMVADRNFHVRAEAARTLGLPLSDTSSIPGG